jgi:hypothetical protein
MPNLSLKSNHKPIKEYYQALEQFNRLGVDHEGAVQSAFQHLLEPCGRQFQWTLIQQFQIKRAKKQALQLMYFTFKLAN